MHGETKRSHSIYMLNIQIDTMSLELVIHQKLNNIRLSLFATLINRRFFLLSTIISYSRADYSRFSYETTSRKKVSLKMVKLKPAVKQCYQTGQFLIGQKLQENVKIGKMFHLIFGIFHYFLSY